MSRRAFRRAGQEDLDQFGPEVRSETKVHLSSITSSRGTPRLRFARRSPVGVGGLKWSLSGLLSRATDPVRHLDEAGRPGPPASVRPLTDVLGSVEPVDDVPAGPGRRHGRGWTRSSPLAQPMSTPMRSSR
jgi:hypothetical protein